MENNNVKIFLTVLGVLVLGVIGTVFLQSSGGSTGTVTPGRLDSFATCLKDKGATFYGAFWCPHCQEQEKWLEASRQTLEQEGLYVECSNPDGQTQNQTCNDKKIAGYPTWEFADGSRLTGEIPLQQLADKTSCQLPK